jgi:hypothetical protein
MSNFNINCLCEKKCTCNYTIKVGGSVKKEKKRAKIARVCRICFKNKKSLIYKCKWCSFTFHESCVLRNVIINDTRLCPHCKRDDFTTFDIPYASEDMSDNADFEYMGDNADFEGSYNEGDDCQISYDAIEDNNFEVNSGPERTNNLPTLGVIRTQYEKDFGIEDECCDEDIGVPKKDIELPKDTKCIFLNNGNLDNVCTDDHPDALPGSGLPRYEAIFKFVTYRMRRFLEIENMSLDNINELINDVEMLREFYVKQECPEYLVKKYE